MSRHFTDPAKIMTFRLAEERDVVALTFLLEEFFGETEMGQRGVRFSHENLCSWLHTRITRGLAPHVVAVDPDGQLVGMVSYSVTSYFTEEPIVLIDKLYVRPEFRKSSIGRTLLATVTALAKAEGAASLRIFINSGVPNTANLFKRMGFDPVPHSVLLRKEI